ncbi:Rieske (2Fe-2S) protein [Ignavibacterium sp.]|uniref:QcrA and Rieske domain-containing protein n=1 Tax=Ignavibacterium sp. TaxID=2651167 RepID=UPI00307EADF4
MNRKKFLKILFASFAVGFVYLWNRLTESVSASVRNKNQITVPDNFALGVTVTENFIVIKSKEQLKILSSKCTHLGCRITGSVNNIFTCPCHGSQFNVDGEVMSGPAMKQLKMLKFKIDKKKNQITIFI